MVDDGDTEADVGGVLDERYRVLAGADDDEVGRRREDVDGAVAAEAESEGVVVAGAGVVVADAGKAALEDEEGDFAQVALEAAAADPTHRPAVFLEEELRARTSVRRALDVDDGGEG